MDNGQTVNITHGTSANAPDPDLKKTPLNLNGMSITKL
jgi:hypothetical protein